MGRFRDAVAAIAQQEDLNFLLTNRIPRRLATLFMGWFSRIEQPLVRDLSIATWRLFADLDLSDAREQRFRSLHDCFVRRLRDGARPIDVDPSVLVSLATRSSALQAARTGTKCCRSRACPTRYRTCSAGRSMRTATGTAPT